VIIDFLKERINGKPQVSRQQVLASRPVRNPVVQWGREARYEETPSVALLRIPRRSDKFGNLVAKLFRLPDFRKLELDEIGSDVWEMCDGTHSVESLTKAVCTKYRLNRRQAETSVTAYLRMLAERRLIALKADRAKAPKAAQNLQRRQKRA
jgi:hypothetical protein